MNEWMLCQKQKADKPYYIETIGKNIFTIEELCFYFWNYAHLLDDSIVNRELCVWLREELAMQELSEQVRELVEQQADVCELALAVLDSTQYLSQPEYGSYVQKLRDLKHMTAFERSKRRADELLSNRKYYKAFQEYQLLLNAPEAREEQIKAKLYHNMGVACCRMFFFKKGSEYFLKAFLTVPGKESMRQYKLALKLCEEELEENELIRQFPGAESVDIQIARELQDSMDNNGEKAMAMEKLQRIKDEGKVAVYYRELEENLQKWRDECREYMSLR